MSWQTVIIVGMVFVFAAGGVLFAIRWWFWHQHIKPAQEENRRLRAKVERELQPSRPWPRR